MIRINDILEEVKSHNAQADLRLIKMAYVFSAQAHDNQWRESGDPYLVHPLSVAFILARMRMDTPSVVAGLLHDTVEDNREVKLADINKTFGDEVSGLVDGVTRIDKINFTSPKHQQAENFKRLLFATNKDVRVILLKLADRLHNMRTLEYMSEKRRLRKSRETMDIYAPLAHRFGIQWVKNELEDLAFRYLDPEAYYDIIYKLSKGRQERGRFINEVTMTLRDLMGSHGMEVKVKGREKNIQSIHRKMLAQGLTFQNVHDLIAFRIIVKDVGECYGALGFIHSRWKPVPGRLKDYIPLPKTNGYQSLHTTVIGPLGQAMEVQIRTEEMNHIAEEGVAAHWRYKEGGESLVDENKKLHWLRTILELDKEENPQEYMDMVKTDLYPEDVYVLTPKGDVINFPRGSTPVDFAYRIHTEVGHQCVGAKVNEKMVPLTHRLKSGDRVEILTRKDHQPNRAWLEFVKTNAARSKIRDFLRKRDMQHSMAAGRSIAEKELRKNKLSFVRAEKTGKLSEAAAGLGYSTVEKMLSDLGIGKLQKARFIQQMLPSDAAASSIKERTLERVLAPLSKKKGNVRIQGVDNVVFSLGKCCAPLPGDEVKGFITLGHGITVHLVDCLELSDKDPNRLVDAEWDMPPEPVFFSVRVDVVVVDAPLMLSNTSKVIGLTKVDISDITSTRHDNGTAVMHYELQVRSIAQLKELMEEVKKVKGVIEVRRIKN